MAIRFEAERPSSSRNFANQPAWARLAGVKLGLRLQIVLLLGGLLVCAFVPLFYAVATYTQVALRQVRHEHARQLGRAIAGHVSEALGQRSQEELESLLNAQAGVGGVEALGVFSESGRVVARAGDPRLIERLSRKIGRAHV